MSGLVECAANALPGKAESLLGPNHVHLQRPLQEKEPGRTRTTCHKLQLRSVAPRRATFPRLRFRKMALSEKSNDELSKLLAEFGIKHGPIVDSTRKLYEKKLEKAMMESPVKPSSDKTFYREEEEEITYITYRNPIRHEGCAEMVKRRVHDEPDGNKYSDQVTEAPVQFTNRTANHSVAHKPVRKSGSRVWKAIRVLLLLAVLAAGAYYAYIYLLNNPDNPFRIQ
ncbi:hypothetical protein Q5P01_007233 [Channa striata]|uniref:LEM domain-containing protein n=1 Tax=Channa striata TaxID=64152 RepID=A0AA88N6C2_CHASR|nr:hypothetical protein Q5P01_007233 [Channa striata]